MKYIIPLFLYLFVTPYCKGQDNYNYTIGFSAGLLTTMAERGPRHVTEVGKVEFLNPMNPVNNIFFDFRAKNKFWIGIELGLDRFDYSYLGTALYQYQGISSGLLTSNEYIHFYKAGLRFSYSIPISNIFTLQSIINPSIGYYPYSHHLADTSNLNAYMYNYRPAGSNKIQYIRYPPQQNEGLHFTAKATLLLACKVSKKLSLTGGVAYQQGFSNFLVDIVSIRQYEPGTLKKFEHTFYTKVNGSSFQFHLGLQFFFK